MQRRALLVGLCAALVAGPAAAAGGSGGGSQAPATRQERLTSAESFVPMPTLSAGVLQRASTRGTLVVDMGIDVPDAALRERAQRNGPRLRDALRTALAVYANTYYRDRTAPDPTQLTRLMQQSIDQALGAPGARVLLVNIIYQRRSS
ncbi:Tat pathway signal protein [Vitreimonas flagellata]|uniref:Tat pathway signal protein n=1 Tax=Vitreimonas flagellata TaxID=2560861 RepID=UPI001075687B|nr:Tat pathway signal protein [Vitreimonas flagellata]